MGKVRMMESPHIPGVYAVETDVDYMYCDNCGSFSIESKEKPQTKTKAILATTGFWIFVGSIAWFLLALILKHNWAFGCILGVIGVIAILIGTPRNYLKCRKCGNKDITDFNVLNYQECDSSVVDVSDNLIIKRYLERKNKHKEK